MLQSNQIWPFNKLPKQKRTRRKKSPTNTYYSCALVTTTLLTTIWFVAFNPSIKKQTKTTKIPINAWVVSWPFGEFGLVNISKRKTQALKRIRKKKIPNNNNTICKKHNHNNENKFWLKCRFLYQTWPISLPLTKKKHKTSNHNPSTSKKNFGRSCYDFF